MTERKDKKDEIANDKLVGLQVPERNEDNGVSGIEPKGGQIEGKTDAQQEESAAPKVSEREKELERKLEETKKGLVSAKAEEERLQKAYEEEYTGKVRAQKCLECVDKEFAKLNEIHKGADYGKIYEYAKEVAQLKLEADECALSKCETYNLKEEKNKLEKEKRDWTEKNELLSRDLQNIQGENESLKMQVSSINIEKGKIEEEKQQLVAKVEAQKKFQDEIVERIIPDCLAQNAPEFVENLRIEACGEMNFDAALLVLAEFSKFAVMERSDAAELIDWQNQLSDIGLVVAKYFHSQQIPEEDVVIQMKALAAVLLCSPKPSELGIQLIVPELGEGFSTDEVTHKNRGTRVSKVLNWCVKDSRGSVYSKAIVE